MSTENFPGLELLVNGLDEAVRLGGIESITSRVKGVLEETDKTLEIPEKYVAPLDDRYARRLLHHCSENRYSVIAMTWGPGQGTPLHDHSGLWCVECVHEGSIDVVQYDLLNHDDSDYFFEAQGTVQASRGAAGALIPPFEYHTITNSSEDIRAVTLHVYGGFLTECAIFEPVEAKQYRKQIKPLECD